jgi:hypothetical protein
MLIKIIQQFLYVRNKTRKDGIKAAFIYFYTHTFYFDDYITEQFMENLKTMIFKMINDEYEVLKQFFNQQTNDLKNKKEILKDNNFLSYRKNAESWLNKSSTLSRSEEKYLNAQLYYLSHFVFCFVLVISVNKGTGNTPANLLLHY